MRFSLDRSRRDSTASWEEEGASSVQAGLLGHVRHFEDEQAQRLCIFPKSWDIHWSDLGNVAFCRWREFRFRRERRLFDLVDINRTGFVTLDEIIHLRERLQRNSLMEEATLERIDLPLLQIQPDLSRSLVALYHFDVRLDGHLNFEEFLLLQDYLREVDSFSTEIMCGCIPKFWARRRRRKARRKREEGMGEEQTPLSPGEERGGGGGRGAGQTPQVNRLLTRRVNTKGELTLAPLDPSYGAQRSSLERPPSSLDARHTSMESLRTCPEPSEEGASGEGARFSLEQEGSFAEWEEAEEEGASPSEREAQEKLSQRRAMLVNSLKSNKGRKRFIEWLYRLADTTQDSTVSQGELVVFLKAISADGINPESFVDPAEDYDDDRRRPTLPLDPEPEPEPLVRTRSDHTVRKSVDEQRKPGYLEQLAERIMERYNDSGTGRLGKEEFMQLAAMVEREYELMDNAYTGADLIGPYRLTRTLGKGAEGVVKLGVNTESGEKKAVKIIRKGNIAALSRVDTEVEAMVMLDHPSVVAVKEVLETEASIFLVMEYCAGGHLEDYISPTRPMSEAAGRFYFGQLMAGVTYCHEKGVCHRDLRVENLMLDNRGHLKITDFGHAGIFQQGWDVFQTMMVGSVSHLAPEQITGTVYSGEKIDIWSMGIILYLMVMGRAPFQAESPEELLEHIKEGQYLKPTEGVISEECCAVIDSMLQVEQQARKPLVELKEMAWMEGARERLVLAHGEFSLTHRTTEPAFLDDLKKILATASVQVREKTKGDVAEALPGHPSLPGTPTPARPPLDPANPAPAEPGYVSEEEGEPDATVRTVAADEEVEELPGGARTVSVSVLHCVHETHKMVFKVSVTMVSVDAGRANLVPVLAFDLQSGEAALFQKVFRRVKAEFGDRVKGADRQHKTKLVNTRVDDTHLPLMDLAEGMGLGRKPSYLHMARSSGSFSRDSATFARSSGTWPR